MSLRPNAHSARNRRVAGTRPKVNSGAVRVFPIAKAPGRVPARNDLFTSSQMLALFAKAGNSSDRNSVNLLTFSGIAFDRRSHGSVNLIDSRPSCTDLTVTFSGRSRNCS